MFKCILALVFLLLFATPAHAELYAEAVSVGGSIAHADCVVRGKVVDSVQIGSPSPAGISVSPWWKITLEVHETFQGPAAKTLTVFCDQATEPDWVHQGSEQLFFLRTGAHAAKGSGQEFLYKFVDFTLDENKPIDLDALTDGSLRSVTDDLRILHSIGQYIQEVQRIVSKMPADTATIYPPVTIGEGRWLRVAITDEAVAAARAWIVSADPTMQWCGAEVLMHVPTPANVAAISCFARSMPPDVPYYGDNSRARILALLQGWHAADVPPLVHATASFFNVRSWTAWLSLASAFLLPALYVLWMRRRARFIALLGYFAIGAVIVLSIRSYWPQDAVTWGNYDVAFERGYVYFIHHSRADKGLPSPLIFCQPQDLLAVQYVNQWRFGPIERLAELGDMIPYSGGSFGTRYLPSAVRRLSWWGRMLSADKNIPLWPLVALLMLPITFVHARRLWQHLRSGRAPGFPVETSA